MIATKKLSQVDSKYAYYNMLIFMMLGLIKTLLE